MGEAQVQDKAEAAAEQPAWLDFVEQTIAALRARFGQEAIEESRFRDNVRVIVPATKVYEVLAFLKNERGFDFLVDITAVDYLHYPNARDRFAVIWSLMRTDNGARLFVKTFLNEPDLTVPTVFDLWKAADWLEREVYDMFGIRFAGHPNLKRILLPEEFSAYPLRKDYPLRGRGERHNFRRLTREQS